MTKTAIYCRVSTDDQEKEGTSLHTQLEACLKYCLDKDYTVVRKFIETFSGLTLDRPKLTDLRNMIRANDLDVIVVYCLDRLSRNATHGVILRDELDKHHVLLESVTEDIDKTPLGEAITYLRGTFAQVEAEKIKERTMRGKLAYVKVGKLPQGTGIGIYGYNWNKATGKRTIHEYESKIVQKIFTMALSGTSTNKIAIELNKQCIRTKSGGLWYPLTIRRIVSNSTYTGKTYYGMTKRVNKTKVVVQPKENWTLLPDITPPIITEEMFKRTQETIAKIKQSRPIKESSPYLLTGFMKCAKCGSPIGGTTLNGKYRYYKCRGSNPTATRGKICDAGYIRANELEKDVWNKVLEMLTSPLTTFALLTDADVNIRARLKQNNPLQILEKQISQLRRKIKAYDAKEKRLYSLLTNEAVTKDFVLDEVNKINKDKLNDNQLLKELLATRKRTNNTDQMTFRLTELSEILRAKAKSQLGNSDTTEYLKEKRNFLESLNLEVVVPPKTRAYQLTMRLGAQIISEVNPDDEAQFNSRLKDFEQQHPEFNIEDLIDIDKQLPGNSEFAKSINLFKQNLVTIEQTSA